MKITQNDYINFMHIIGTSVDFYCEIIETEDIDTFLEVYMEDMPNPDEFLESIKDQLSRLDRFIFMSISMVDVDYVNFINQLPNLLDEDKKFLIPKDSGIINLEYILEGNNQTMTTFFLVNLFKIKTKRKTKSKIELEIELESAVEREDYEKAIKLREKIKKIGERKVKKK